MALIKGFKMDGLGNDFVIIDRSNSSFNLSKKKIIELGKRETVSDLIK